MTGYIDEADIRKAIDTPKVAYELGRLVGFMESAKQGGIAFLSFNLQEVQLWSALGAELLDTNENDSTRRLRYIVDKLDDYCELVDSILDPVVNPDDYTGDNVRQNVAEQLLINVVDAQILDYREWCLEEDEIARDEAIQRKIDISRGK